MDQLSPQALLQLCQYQPCRDGGVTREAAFEHMVPAVLMESGGGISGTGNLCEAFETLFGVEIEPTEIDKWLENLESQKVVEKDGSVITVTDSTRQLLEERRLDFESLSTTARSEWRAWLIMNAPKITDDQLEEMEKELDDLIALMVAYHGAEAAAILHPGEPRAAALRETLIGRVGALPELDPHLDEVRREGLALFFSSPTEAQRRYLADRLDHGFFATVGTLRPTAAPVMREEMAGHRLYLDTNLLIPALGRAGSSVNASTRRLLELTRGLGVELAVTSRTLQEYQHSLRRARSEVTKSRLPDRRFGGVMRDKARMRGGISLAEGFYESYVSRGTDPDEWFRLAALVEPKLLELDVEVIDDGLSAVLKNEADRVKGYVDLLSRIDFQKRRGRDPRGNLRWDHDAVHRVLIERLRGRSHRTFGSAQFWFLTEDKVLPHFALEVLDEEEEGRIPFCISGGAWAQIARCFTPRTDDYDQTVTDLLASPYIRFGQAHDLGEVQQVVGRITTLLEDASPALVAAFVKDETIEAVASAKDPAEKDEVALRIYDKVKDEVAERMNAIKSRVVEVEASRAGPGTADGEDSESLLRRLEEVEAARARERHMSSQEIEDLRVKQRQDQEEWERKWVEERARREDEERKRRERQAMGVAASLLVALVVLTVLGEVSFWLPLLAAGSVVAFLVSDWMERSPWAWRAGFVLGVVGVLLGVVQLLQ
jgi:hypothetical protein